MKSSNVLNHRSWNKIPARWFADATDRLLATDGHVARGAEEDGDEEDEEDEDKKDKDDDSEDEGGGYSE